MSTESGTREVEQVEMRQWLEQGRGGGRHGGLTHAHALFTEAEETINGPRRASYGETKASFERVAQAWGCVLGVPVTAQQVVLMMIAFKVCREANAHKHDNVVDMVGYAGLLAELHGGEK